MAVCVRCFVSGRVQGVFYRASARHEAQQRGLTGYARNLADGRVEVLVCGSKTGIDDFCAWLAEGPAQAEVSNVSCSPVEAIAPAGFEVR